MTTASPTVPKVGRTLRYCIGCGQTKEEHLLKRCENCQQSFYCAGTDCARNHWIKHSPECKVITLTRDILPKIAPKEEVEIRDMNIKIGRMIGQAMTMLTPEAQQLIFCIIGQGGSDTVLHISYKGPVKGSEKLTPQLLSTWITTDLMEAAAEIFPEIKGDIVKHRLSAQMKEGKSEYIEVKLISLEDVRATTQKMKNTPLFDKELTEKWEKNPHKIVLSCYLNGKNDYRYYVRMNVNMASK